MRRSFISPFLPFVTSLRLEYQELKMNILILSILVCAAGLCTAEQYTDRYDDFNLDEILQNKRLLVAYVKCLLDKGRCTPEGKELKVHITDAITTGCSKCTIKQRQGARKVVNHLKENEQEYWQEIIAKYDPGNKNKEIYEAFLAADE